MADQGTTSHYAIASAHEGYVHCGLLQVQHLWNQVFSVRFSAIKKSLSLSLSEQASFSLSLIELVCEHLSAVTALPP